MVFQDEKRSKASRYVKKSGPNPFHLLTPQAAKKARVTSLTTPLVSSSDENSQSSTPSTSPASPVPGPSSIKPDVLQQLKQEQPNKTRRTPSSKQQSLVVESGTLSPVKSDLSSEGDPFSSPGPSRTEEAAAAVLNPAPLTPEESPVSEATRAMQRLSLDAQSPENSNDAQLPETPGSIPESDSVFAVEDKTPPPPAASQETLEPEELETASSTTPSPPPISNSELAAAESEATTTPPSPPIVEVETTTPSPISEQHAASSPFTMSELYQDPVHSSVGSEFEGPGLTSMETDDSSESETTAPFSPEQVMDKRCSLDSEMSTRDSDTIGSGSAGSSPFAGKHQPSKQVNTALGKMFRTPARLEFRSPSTSPESLAGEHEKQQVPGSSMGEVPIMEAMTNAIKGRCQTAPCRRFTKLVEFTEACDLGKTAEVIYLVYKEFVNVNDILTHDMSPLQHACGGRHFLTVRTLLELGANPNYKRQFDHLTALIVLASTAKVEDEGLLQCAEAVVAAGGDINIAQKDGMTPFLFAVHRGHVKLATFLLQNDADISHNDILSRGVTDFAKMCGKSEIMEFVGSLDRSELGEEQEQKGQDASAKSNENIAE